MLADRYDGVPSSVQPVSAALGLWDRLRTAEQGMLDRHLQAAQAQRKSLEAPGEDVQNNPTYLQNLSRALGLEERAARRASDPWHGLGDDLSEMAGMAFGNVLGPRAGSAIAHQARPLLAKLPQGAQTALQTALGVVAPDLFGGSGAFNSRSGVTVQQHPWYQILANTTQKRFGTTPDKLPLEQIQSLAYRTQDYAPPPGFNLAPPDMMLHGGPKQIDTFVNNVPGRTAKGHPAHDFLGTHFTPVRETAKEFANRGPGRGVVNETRTYALNPFKASGEGMLAVFADIVHLRSSPQNRAFVNKRLASEGLPPIEDAHWDDIGNVERSWRSVVGPANALQETTKDYQKVVGSLFRKDLLRRGHDSVLYPNAVEEPLGAPTLISLVPRFQVEPYNEPRLYNALRAGSPAPSATGR